MELRWKNGDIAPDHMEEIYFISAQHKAIEKSVFKLVWAELEDNTLSGEYIEYEQDDPGKGWCVAGMIYGFDWDNEWGFVQDTLIWVTDEEMSEYIKSKLLEAENPS